MSLNVTFNGAVYIIPETGEVGWGGNTTSYLVAIAAGALQKTGGSFTLSADTDFGASFGLKSLYYKSRSANIAAAGILRLNNNSDSINWRNAANNADLPLTVDASDRLLYNGVPVLTGTTPGAYVSSITGTTNQVIASASTGPVTLSLPQSINTSAAVQFGTLGLGSAAVVSSILSLTSSTLGFLPPRLTTTERDAIASPATGLLIFNTSTQLYNFYTGTVWTSITASSNVINPGTINRLAYYAATGTALSELSAITALRALESDASGLPVASSVTSTELAYVSGVTSAIQTQLNLKAPLASPTFTGTVTIPSPFTLGATSVTASGTEMNYLVGVTSPIQTQLDGKAVRALSNLASVAINTTLVSDTDNTDDLGTISIAWKDIFLKGALKSGGSTLATITELGYLTGVTSAIQTQLNARALDSAVVHLTGNETIAGIKNFTDNITWNNTSPSAPLHIGTLSGTSHVFAILAARAFSTGASNAHVYSDSSTFTGNNGTSFATFSADSGTVGSNNHGHIIAFQANNNHSSSGTLTDAYGFSSDFINNGGLTTNRYGALIADATGSGSITNQYGLYINSLIKGSSLNYAIYTAGTTPSVFNGQILVGNGSNGAPSVAFLNSTNTGLRKGTGNSLVISANGGGVAEFAATGVSIQGTTTNDNASTGNVGEYLESLVTTATNTGASGVISDATSLSLTAGDWDISALVEFKRNGATFTSTDLEIGITTTAGNSATGLVNGSNYVYAIQAVPTTFTALPMHVPVYRVSIASTTTFYLKMFVDVYTAGTPQYHCRLSARRVR